MTSLPASHPLASGRTAASRLIGAYQGRRQPVAPVWFMRQAGRSLPEYRALRVGTRMLDACLDPALASEITLQPVRRHGVDAAIFFSDIVIPLKLAGLEVEIVPGKGPVFANPVRTAEDVRRLTALDPASLTEETFAPVAEGVRLTVEALAEIGRGDTPLIGFAGAPFTLAAYLVEGGPSKDHLRARTLMHADPEAWAALAGWIADVTGAFLRAQVLAGASAAQVFDSWAGSLSLADYARSVAPASARVIEHVRDLVYPAPVAGSGTGAGPGGDADPVALAGAGAASGGQTEPATGTAPADGVTAGHGIESATGAAAADGIARGDRTARGDQTAAGDGTAPADRTGSGTAPSADLRRVPIVHFGVGTGELLTAMRDTGADVMGVDDRVPLDEASARLGGTVPLQGNIDPALLAAPWPVLEAHVRDVLDRGRSAPSHVLNLGHGVPPETDPAVLTRIVELAHGS